MNDTRNRSEIPLFFWTFFSLDDKVVSLFVRRWIRRGLTAWFSTAVCVCEWVSLSLSSLCASSAHHLVCFSLWNAELLFFLRVPCSWDSVAVRTKRGVCSCATSMASSVAHSAAALVSSRNCCYESLLHFAIVAGEKRRRLFAVLLITSCVICVSERSSTSYTPVLHQQQHLETAVR